MLEDDTQTIKQSMDFGGLRYPTRLSYRSVGRTYPSVQGTRDVALNFEVLFAVLLNEICD